MSSPSAGPTSQGLTATVHRYATLIQSVSIALIAVSVVLILRQVPLRPGVEALEEWLAGLGLWGPIVFGLVYVVAVVLVAPASALTLVAGALFGLVTGMIVVSLASTTGAALAFLIGRYLARDRIAQTIAAYPRFDAIDKAISAEGWKIVALLRLSPAVPFNLQNYLYGLTGIPFWPCVLTSWVAMLPGTFLYVYLGQVGRAGLEAAAGAERSRSPGEWAMLVIGLLATVAVTVYVARLARQAIKLQTAITDVNPTSRREQPAPRGWPWGATMAAVLALIVLGAAIWIQLNPKLLNVGAG